jgi:hypothetical protein
MNFGPPFMKIEEPRISAARSPAVRALFARRRINIKGAHWLVCNPATWRLTLADGLDARCSSSAKRQDLATARLQGEKLETIVINAVTSATVFAFDLGARLTVRLPRGGIPAGDELWWLYARSRRRSVWVFPGGAYRMGSSSSRTQPITSGSGEGCVVIGKTSDDVSAFVR